MIGALLLGAALAVQQAPSADITAENLRAYEEAEARAGRDADSQVDLALWCERRGLTAERVKHLSLAVLRNPDHPVARGLLGMVAYGGRWMTPGEIRDAIERDPNARSAMQEYLQRRASTADTADAQARLARWCDERGLADQATAHYKAVVRLDPSREAVWKKLGYKKSRGRWLRAEDIATEKADGERRDRAEKHWRPILEKHRNALLGKVAERRRLAAAELERITDPSAVAVIHDVFVRNDIRLQRQAVEILARIDGPDASLALASLAVSSPFPEVRGSAAEVLRRRDPREFLGALIDLIRKPFRYQVKRLDGSNSRGALFVEGEQFNIQRFYGVLFNISPDQVPRRLFTPETPLQTDASGILAGVMGWGGAYSGNATLVGSGGTSPVQVPGVPGLVLESDGGKGASAATLLMRSAYAEAVRRDLRLAGLQAEIRDRARRAEQNLERDAAFVEDVNQQIRNLNDRVLPVIVSVSGRDFGDRADEWKTWWNDEIGYAYQSSTPAPNEKPTYYDFIEVPVAPPHSACFAAGTPVRTLEGPKPIESLQVGDRVLSQNADTGAISYQPVLVIHHNPPTATLKLKFGSETIVATGIHRFWKPGKGWVMARDLKPGDAVRVLGGTLALDAVEPGEVQPVYNLDVAENRDFFVGERGFLVYDFSIVQPPDAPFDAPTVAVRAESAAP